MLKIWMKRDNLTKKDVARWMHAPKVSTPPIPILLPPGLKSCSEAGTRKSHSRDEPLNQSEFDPEKSLYVTKNSVVADCQSV